MFGGGARCPKYQELRGQYFLYVEQLGEGKELALTLHCTGPLNELTWRGSWERPKEVGKPLVCVDWTTIVGSLPVLLRRTCAEVELTKVTERGFFFGRCSNVCMAVGIGAAVRSFCLLVVDIMPGEITRAHL
uniref:Uncharacterized protein n=1 Tax=Oryza brachyantha TaxID=4533 RepID=J3N540_ORYBR